MKRELAANEYRTLKESRKFLTEQQYRTIKGQLRSGDVQGAMRGLKNIAERNRKHEVRKSF